MLGFVPRKRWGNRSHILPGLTFGEPLAKTDHPVTGRVGNVICVRENGTGYDMHGETDVPGLTPVEKK